MDDDDQSFVEDYVTWNDAAFKGRKREIDKALGEVRGGNALSGLQWTEDRLRTRAANPGNKASVRTKAAKDAEVAKDLRESGDVVDKPTTIRSISKNYENIYKAATQRGIDQGTPIPGAGWFFDHRRGQGPAVAPEANLSGRQITAMGGRLSSGKTPEDETASLGGISRLVSTHSDRMINGRTVSSIPSRELGDIASAASSWNAYRTGGSKDAAPEVDEPDFGDDEDLRSTTVQAGRPHADNVADAISVARKEVAPAQLFSASSTPKTAAYAEMQAQSDPDTVLEADYKSLATHVRDIQAGTQNPNQGMFIFSQEEGQERPYAMRPDAPTAIDTWMVAGGSGQPLKSTRTSTTKGGKQVTRTNSPAKRLVDKDFPLSPDAYTKEKLGLPMGDTRITPVSAVSAQHNEAIQQVSRRIGSVSFDQFGNDIFTPSSLIHETTWTEARKQAGGDKEFNAEQAAKAKAEKAAARSKARQAKIDAKNNPTLF